MKHDTTFPTCNQPAQLAGSKPGLKHAGWQAAFLSAVAGAILLLAGAAQANLLYNPGFELSTTNWGPDGWSAWGWGNGGVNWQTNPPVDSGYYIVCWSGTWNAAGGGFYQIVTNIVAGSTYVLSVDSDTEAWWNPLGESRMFFLNAGGGTISSFVQNVTQGNANLPWTTYSQTNVAPPGTVAVKIEFAINGTGGAVHFDNANLYVLPAPVVSGVSPDGSILMQPTSSFTFTVSSSTATINASAIHLTLNGTDVSSNLLVTGSAMSKTAVYSGLKTNQAYTATIQATDANGVGTTSSITFDTFNPTFLWEAEDFDFSGGMYFNTPVLSSTNAPDSYFGQIGEEGIDEHDIGHTGPETYRTNDFMSTGPSGDTPRANFVAAEAIDPEILDYCIGYFDTGEWVNYTRSFPAGKYNVYARLASGASGVSTIYLSQVTNGQGTASQAITPLGSFQYTGTGWGAYQYVPLADAYGNPVAVSLNGVTTLRITAGTGNMNFFFVVPARLDLPVISGVYPSGTVLMQPTNTFVFNVSSPSATIPASGIRLSLNGTDVSSSLAITGSSTSKAVTYTGLKTNTAYTAVISVTDANGSVATSTIRFDTFEPSFVWEAEDWDFQDGQYINNPTPTSTAAANSYFGLIGVQGVDENETENDPANQYRAGDPMNASVCGDVPRQKYLDAQVTDPSVQDWNVGYFDSGEWVNYTRSFPAGTYNVYARLANGNAGTATIYMDQVITGAGTSTQATTGLGTFSFPAQGWNTYSYVPLRDRYGNYAELSLNGVATLRARAGGANMNFFMLTAPRNDLPRISNVYPDGTLELQGTNFFRFTASNPTVPIYGTNVNLTLNGVDVSSQLTLSGTPNSWNASVPIALNVPRYAAVITVTDANTNVATTTIYFDTFNPASYTWEAEDFDFNSGLFIDNPVPTSGPADDSYFGQSATAEVDYHCETWLANTPYTYYGRGLTLGIDICGDYPPLAKYVTAELADPNVKDYNLAYWSSNSWASYTHTYPAGTYNVYARMASGQGGSVQLDKVTATATNHLGQFNLQNWGWGIYNWWPLVDATGQLVTVTLGGQTTLRATTDGSANANRYALVTPLAVLARPPIAAEPSGNSIQLSFPTQTGHVYVVWAKNNLTDANWTMVATLAGTGSPQSWTDPNPGAHRFYRVQVQ
ncbi:MAG TPA: carbohydrate-binding protein [Candidatus Acidoferrum sp.]|nr:carbohydrate-binding protein [Candidatus Acidoferrum sp.]